jgi:hypothetical protein
VTWEQPTALWLLATIALLFFARSTTPRQRVAVANLFLWADLESRTTSAISRRVRRHWLLILQAAFVAVVAIALARPLISFGGHRSAIIIDVSMSMGAREGSATRLETARAGALSLVRELPRGGRATIWLASASAATNLGEFSSSGPSVERVLQAVHATDAAADLAVAIEQVRTADPAVSRIHVLSDTAPPQSAGVEWRPVGAPADNVALTTLQARRLADRTVALLVGVANHGTSVVGGDILITRGTSTLARRTLSLQPGQASSVVFDLPDFEGVVGARLEVADDLAADNTRFTIVDPVTPLRTLLIGRDHWIEQALAALPGVVASEATLDPVAIEPDLVICAGCAEVPATHPRAGVLLLPPSASSPDKPSPLVVTNGRHRLLQGVTADGGLVSPVGGRPLAEGAEVLATAATLPAIVVQDSGHRRIVELRIDSSASHITADVTFPLLVANAVEWLAAGRHRPSVLVAGETLRHVLPAGAGEATVYGPDGRVVPSRLVGAELVAGDIATAGIYRVRTGDQNSEFVVNPAAGPESNLADQPSGTSVAPSPADLSGTDSTGMTPGLLLAALGLLALEWRHRLAERGR